MQLVELLLISVPLSLTELFQKHLKELQILDGLTYKDSIEKLQKERAYVTY